MNWIEKIIRVILNYFGYYKPEQVTIKFKNFSFGKLRLFKPKNNEVYYQNNFSQAKEHTKVIPDDITDLILIEPNLVNCDIPSKPGIKVIGGLHIQKSFCTHLHPNMVPPLTPCPVNCQHLVNTDTVTVDGKEALKSYRYKDKVVT